MFAACLTALPMATYFSLPALDPDIYSQPFFNLLAGQFILIFLIACPVWMLGVNSVGLGLWAELNTKRVSAVKVALICMASAAGPATILAAFASEFGPGLASILFVGAGAFSGAAAGAFIHRYYEPPSAGPDDLRPQVNAAPDHATPE